MPVAVSGCGSESELKILKASFVHLDVARSGQSFWSGTRRPQVRILPSRPLARSSEAERLAVNQDVGGSIPPAPAKFMIEI